MGSWEYVNLGLWFDKSKNDEEKIKKIMKELGNTESNYLYMEETGVDGPRWDYSSGNCELCYENDGGAEEEELFAILNTLFNNVSVYVVYALGSNTSDYYSGTEITFDAISMNCLTREFDYCDGDCTAFGEKVAEDEIEKRGIIEIKKRGIKESKEKISIDSIFAKDKDLKEWLEDLREII